MDYNDYSSYQEYPPVNYRNLNNSSLNSSGNSNTGTSILSTLGDSITSLFRSNNSITLNSNKDMSNGGASTSASTTPPTSTSTSSNIKIANTGGGNFSPPISPIQSPHSSQRSYKGLSTSNNNYNTPLETQLLMMTPNSPQNSQSLQMSQLPAIDDFIVLSEFSEQSGPIALNIIPEHSFVFGNNTFDLSKYVVKIMSVDFQNKTNDLKTYAKDSQMFYTVTNSDQNEVYAYVHHFSLFDIQARGYVRPLVLSYITRNPNKIIKFFDKFIYHFNQLTSLLKTKNHVLFEQEYQQKKKDLEYTLEYYNQLKEQQQQLESSVDAVLAAEPGLNETVIKMKQTYIVEMRSTIIEMMSEMQSIELLFENERKSHSNVSSGRTGTSSMPFYMESSLGTIYYSPEPITTGEPKIIDSIGKTGHLDNPLRHIFEICPVVFEKFLHKLEQCYQYFSRSSLQMEFDSLDIISHLPQSSLLTIGTTSILNFGLELETSRKNQHYNKSMMKEISYKSTPSKPFIKIKSPSHTSLDSYSSDPSSYLSVLSSTSLNEHFNDFMNDKENNSGYSNRNPLDQLPPQPNNLLNSTNSNLNHSLNQSNTSVTNNNNNNNVNFNIKYETFSNYLWGANRRPSYGKGLWKLKYSWLRHVVYSLLKGRTVVIVGSQDKEQSIIAMVYALSIFAIGQSSNGKSVFDSWKTVPLNIGELSHLKLVGMPKVNRSQLIPSNVATYISKVDLDTEEYLGPLYSNNTGLIDEILGQKRTWINENLYTGHVETQLFELAIKSFYYYHLICVPLTLDNFNRLNSFPTPPPTAQSSFNNYSAFNGYSPRSTNNNSTTQLPLSADSPSHQLSFSTGILPSISSLSTSAGDQNQLNQSSGSLLNNPNIKFVPVHYPSPNSSQPNSAGSSVSSNHLLPPQAQKLTSGLGGNPQPKPPLPLSNPNLKATRSMSESQLKSLPKFNNNTSPMMNGSNNIPSSHQSLKNTSPLNTPSSSPGHTMSKSVKIPDPKAVFKRWEVSNPQDQLIIEYLAEVVKDQQYYEAFHQIEVTPIIKLDYTPLVLVKNKK